MTGRPVLSLTIADIAIASDRVGYFDASHAARLGADFEANGQHDPIHVRRNGNAAKVPWTLVAGLHRLRGAEGIGWATIDAIQVADACTSKADLRRLELSENVDHRHRRPIERAIMMAELARLEEEIDHPGRAGETSQARALRVRQSTSAIVADVDWRERAAAAMHCSLRTLETYQRIHRAIVEGLPDLAEAINFHPLGDSLSAMSKLAAQPLDNIHDNRRVAAEAILSRPDWKSISEAFVAAGLSHSTGFRTDPDKPDEARFLSDFRKMPVHHRHSIFLNMARRVPASWVRETIDSLKELLP